MEPKSYREFAASIIETLEALGIEYAIGGSFASSAYGEAGRQQTLISRLSCLYLKRDVL
jgi:hypothetical protein